jgi:peptidoglycan/LPS O-acetylase OafA/YrhL
VVICFLVVRWTDSHLTNLGDAGDFAKDFTLDVVVALGYSVVLICAKNLKKPRNSAAHRVLSSFSYTVYLVHFPAMMFVAAFMKDVLDIGFGRQPTVAAITYAVALLVILYGYAWIFAAFTEAHTNTIRSRLSLVVSAFRHQANFLGRHRFSSGADAVLPKDA